MIFEKLRRVKHALTAPEKGNKGKFECTVCSRKEVAIKPLPAYYLAQWQKYQHIHNLFLYETLNIEHFYCSMCEASDRDRLYALYLKSYLNGRLATNILDIAPGTALREFIKKQYGVSYRSTDLYMDGVDDKQSITDMNLYTEGQFDFIICSHVLEHIPDDVQAMRELYRVLNRGGKAIVMVPMNAGVEKTLENSNETDVPTRWKLYGQDDHIRQYAKADFVSRLENVGFKVTQMAVNDFKMGEFERYGIYPTSVLYIAEKQITLHDAL
jgi:SAM-dependent methyltransferase